MREVWKSRYLNSYMEEQNYQKPRPVTGDKEHNKNFLKQMITTKHNCTEASVLLYRQYDKRI